MIFGEGTIDNRTPSLYRADEASVNNVLCDKNRFLMKQGPGETGNIYDEGLYVCERMEQVFPVNQDIAVMITESKASRIYKTKTVYT